MEEERAERDFLRVDAQDWVEDHDDGPELGAAPRQTEQGRGTDEGEDRDEESRAQGLPHR